MSDLRSKIAEVLAGMPLVGLATVTEDGKPWVRYMMPKVDENLTLRFATSRKSRKAKQIENNPEVHITCGVTDPQKVMPYLQIQGRARLDLSEQTRHDFWIDALAAYFQGPDDPDYTVIEVVPYRIEYMSLGSFEPQVLDL